LAPGGILCRSPADASPTAAPGYTFVSYAGYIPTLVLMLTGLSSSFAASRSSATARLFALFPFMLFGGALRVVEDANAAAFVYTGDGHRPAVVRLHHQPADLLHRLLRRAARGREFGLARAETTTSRATEYPLAGIGTGLLTLTVLFLAYGGDEGIRGFYPLVPLVILVGATLTTAITWVALERFAPELNRGTGYMGIVVIWAHAVGGVANVIGLGGRPRSGSRRTSFKAPDQPGNRETTADVLPANIVSITGSAWPFLFVKIAAAVFVIWIFDETVFEDSPRYAVLLMITVVAVGLGQEPATCCVRRSASEFAFRVSSRVSRPSAAVSSDGGPAQWRPRTGALIARRGGTSVHDRYGRVVRGRRPR